jgi:DNA polymerase III subunit epsilon
VSQEELRLSPPDLFAAGPFAALDFETATPDGRDACSIGVVTFDSDGKITEEFYEKIRPLGGRVAEQNQRVHGLSWKDLEESPSFPEVWERAREIIAPCRAFVAHNAPSDAAVLRKCEEHWKITPRAAMPWICTMKLAASVMPNQPRKLKDLAALFAIPFPSQHEALSDARTAARVFLCLRPLLRSDLSGPATDPPEPDAALLLSRIQSLEADLARLAPQPPPLELRLQEDLRGRGRAFRIVQGPHTARAFTEALTLSAAARPHWWRGWFAANEHLSRK